MLVLMLSVWVNGSNVQVLKEEVAYLVFVYSMNKQTLKSAEAQILQGIAQVSEFLSRVNRLACPSTLVSSQELALSHSIDHVCTESSKTKALKALSDHPGSPALFQYVSDGWSALTNMVDTTRVEN